mgnify:CR=1 FL=1
MIQSVYLWIGVGTAALVAMVYFVCTYKNVTMHRSEDDVERARRTRSAMSTMHDAGPMVV